MPTFLGFLFPSADETLRISIGTHLLSLEKDDTLVVEPMPLAEGIDHADYPPVRVTFDAPVGLLDLQLAAGPAVPYAAGIAPFSMAVRMGRQPRLRDQQYRLLAQDFFRRHNL